MTGTAYAYNRSGARDLSAFVATTGTQVDPAPGKGVTLANATTYYVPFGDDAAPIASEASLVAIHIKWDTAFIGVITVETTNFPLRKTGAWVGQPDVTDWDTTVGNWIQENPPSPPTYISVVSTDGSTGNATETASAITVAGGTAGGCMFHLSGFGSRRARMKIVSTTGGVVRVSCNGKNAS